MEDRFATHVEAVRTGFVTAQDKKALNKWRSRQRTATGDSVGLTGAALERAVMAIAAKDPSLVAVRA